MPFGSYTDLQSSVARWLKRTNLNDQIPDFIALAEVRLNRRLSVRQMRTWYSVTPSQPFVTLPGDWNRPIRVMYGEQRLDFTSENIADPIMTEGGQWNQFTIAGNKLWMLTNIDGLTKLTLHYLQNIEPLSDSNTSNWLLEDAPDLYLYASLLEAEVFIKNDERIQVWTAALERAIGDLETNDEASQYGGSSLAMKRA